MEKKHIKNIVVFSSFILVFCLICLQLGLTNIVFAYKDDNQEVSVHITSQLKEDKTASNVHINVKNEKERNIVSSIELPDGRTVDGDNASYLVTENGTVTFKVNYKVPVIHINSLIPTDTEPIYEDKQIEKSYTVTDIQSGEKVESQVSELQVKEDTMLEGDDNIPQISTSIDQPSTNDLTVNQADPAAPKDVTTIKSGAFTFDTAGTLLNYDVSIGGANVVIPESYADGILVTKIADNAFYQKRITSVKFPESNHITSIGNYAFKETRLWDVVLPSSLTSIGVEAFAYSYVRNVSSMPYTGSNPAPEINIKTGAFRNNNITSLDFEAVFQNRLKKINDSVFASNSFERVAIPSSVTSIANDAFNRAKIQFLRINEGVKNIGARAFSSNKIKSVRLPNSLTSIGNNAFESNQLSYLIIPGKVTSIGSNIMDNQVVNSLACYSNIPGKYFVDLTTYGLGYELDKTAVKNPQGFTDTGAPMTNFAYNRGTGVFTFDGPDELPDNYYITYDYQVKNGSVTSSGSNTVKLDNLRTFCTVIFDPSGGSLPSDKQYVKVPKGQRVLVLPTPTNPYNEPGKGDNFTWYGVWYKDPELTQWFDNSKEVINSNMTLYTGWIPKDNNPQVFLEIPSGIKMYDFPDGYAKGKGSISLKTLNNNVRWYEDYIFHVKPTTTTFDLVSTSPISKDKFTVDILKPDNTIYNGSGDFINLNINNKYGCKQSETFTLRTPLDKNKRSNIDYEGTLTFSMTLEQKTN